jgi:hypothetical protein
MAEYGIQVGKVAFVGLLSAILTVAVVMGLTALYSWQVARVETAVALEGPPAKLEAQWAAQQARLTDYWMVDAKKGVVAIPVSRAMDLVVEELSHEGAD